MMTEPPRGAPTESNIECPERLISSYPNKRESNSAVGSASARRSVVPRKPRIPYSGSTPPPSPAAYSPAKSSQTHSQYHPTASLHPTASYPNPPYNPSKSNPFSH